MDVCCGGYNHREHQSSKQQGPGQWTCTAGGAGAGNRDSKYCDVRRKRQHRTPRTHTRARVYPPCCCCWSRCWCSASCPLALTSAGGTQAGLQRTYIKNKTRSYGRGVMWSFGPQAELGATRAWLSSTSTAARARASTLAPPVPAALAPPPAAGRPRAPAASPAGAPSAGTTGPRVRRRLDPGRFQYRKPRQCAPQQRPGAWEPMPARSHCDRNWVGRKLAGRLHAASIPPLKSEQP